MPTIKDVLLLSETTAPPQVEYYYSVWEIYTDAPAKMIHKGQSVIDAEMIAKDKCNEYKLKGFKCARRDDDRENKNQENKKST